MNEYEAAQTQDLVRRISAREAKSGTGTKIRWLAQQTSADQAMATSPRTATGPTSIGTMSRIGAVSGRARAFGPPARDLDVASLALLGLGDPHGQDALVH
jgi:hypothetical protein